MLRTAKRHGQTPETAKPWSLVMFTVGGKQVAVRAEEIGGVSPWTEAMPVPSLTPYVNAVIRQGDDILPVFDFARLLMVQVSKVGPLCLRAKRQDGLMAVCIDPDVPTLHQVEAKAVRPAPSGLPGVIGVCSIGSDDVPIYSWTMIGQAPTQQVA
jgi:chemotaxis signal transduction protein